MSTLIQIARGTREAISGHLLENAEPAWAIDTKQLYMGDGETLGGVLISDTNNSDVVWSYYTYNSDFYAYSNIIYGVDTRPNEVRVYLPEIPRVGMQIRIVDLYSNFGTNNVILDGNGNTIYETLSEYRLTQPGSYIIFYAYNSAKTLTTWYVIRSTGEGWYWTGMGPSSNYNVIYVNTSPYQAEHLDWILADTTISSILIHAPINPVLGMKFVVQDYAGLFETHNVMVRSDELINGSTDDFIINTNESIITFIYDIGPDGIYSWYTYSGYVEGTGYGGNAATANNIILRNVQFDGSVTHHMAVYYNSSDNKFYPAIADGTNKQRVIGLADTSNNSIVAIGFVRNVDIFTFSLGSILYLSSTIAGSLSTINTNVKLALQLGNNTIWLFPSSISSGGSSVTVSTTPPPNPNNGDLWFDSTSASLYIWYFDGDSSQWVGFGAGGSGGSGGSASVYVGEIPPESPIVGDLWFDSITGKMYIWYVDDDSSQWVGVGSSVGGGIAEAPLDGVMYVRKDGDWISIGETRINVLTYFTGQL